VVVSKLNEIAVALATSDLPQNVNFAIKAGTVHSFAEAQGIALKPASTSDLPLEPADLAEKVKLFSTQIVCIR